MTENTTYLITGANRGIGLALTTHLLSRANTTILATYREANESQITDFQNIPHHPTSVLKPLNLTYASLSTTPSDFLSTLSSHGIQQIDIIIANAGTSSFSPILTTSLSQMQENFDINTLFPILLFQTLHPLLSLSNPKFIVISSVLGSINVGTQEGDTLAYGMSKAAANYFVRKVHFEFEHVSALAVHPGWVRTQNGEKYRDSLVGYEGEIPLSVEESAKGVVEQIDALTKMGTSGSFVSYDGSVLPW